MKQKLLKLSVLLISFTVLILACKKEEPMAKAPEVGTLTVSSITTNSFEYQGTVTADGGAEITAKGICYGTEENPTLSDQKTVEGKGKGEVKGTINDLTSGKVYYARVYATNSAGTTYGTTVKVVLQKLEDLAIEKEALTMEVTEETTIKVTAGSTDYTIVSSDDQKATATEKDGVITVIAKVEGMVTVTIKDNKTKQSKTINITIEKQSYIEFTTTKAVEKTIELSIDANKEDKAGIWIDLNNNGTKDNGEKVTSFGNNVAYTLGSQTVRVYGKVTAFGTSYKWIKEQQKYIGQQLTSLDISQNKELEFLYCPGNQLTSLDISQNKELEYLNCSYNQLTSLEVSQNKELKSLNCSGNQLTSLEVSQNKELKSLDCGGNPLTSLDISQNKELKSLSCSDNQLTSLDISQNTQLKDLFCPGNQLTSLDISQNKELRELYCDYNQLTSLDISQNTKMKLLRCYHNSNLTCIKVNQEQLNNIPSNWQKDDTATYSTNCN